MFEFNCKKCGHDFEELISLAELEAGDLECPSCLSPKVERKLSTFASSTTSDAPCGAGSSAPCGRAGGGFT